MKEQNELIKDLFDAKANGNNTIYLNAYAQGLEDMLSKITELIDINYQIHKASETQRAELKDYDNAKYHAVMSIAYDFLALGLKRKV